jgi:hypothetical protein
MTQIMYHPAEKTHREAMSVTVQTTLTRPSPIYRARVGDELFTCVAEYTSPMVAIYGVRHAPPVKSDTITSQTKLLAALQKAIIDTPEVTIELGIRSAPERRLCGNGARTWAILCRLFMSRWALT